MSLNPFTLINQLIEEHGSAGIMGKHLAFLKEQLSVLKEEGALASRKTTLLETENARLGAENKDLREQIQNLHPNAQRLHDDAAKILNLFFENGGNLALQDVTRHFGFQKSVADFHFDSLLNGELITQTVGEFENFNGIQPSMYAISSKGRKHCMEGR